MLKLKENYPQNAVEWLSRPLVQVPWLVVVLVTKAP
jgi:hypothetical protein